MKEGMSRDTLKSDTIIATESPSSLRSWIRLMYWVNWKTQYEWMSVLIKDTEVNWERNTTELHKIQRRLCSILLAIFRFTSMCHKSTHTWLWAIWSSHQKGISFSCSIHLKVVLQACVLLVSTLKYLYGFKMSKLIYSLTLLSFSSILRAWSLTRFCALGSCHQGEELTLLTVLSFCRKG